MRRGGGGNPRAPMSLSVWSMFCSLQLSRTRRCFGLSFPWCTFVPLFGRVSNGELALFTV